MKYAKLAALLALPVAFAATLGAAPQPAEAGKACNELGLKSPCVRSSDVRPNLKLGKPGNDGDLIVRDSSKVSSVQIDGDTGDVTNSFAGNGLVKAWAMINADGTVSAFWRCNPAATSLINNPGSYQVDFTPVSTNITGRPRLATLDFHNATVTSNGEIGMANFGGDASSVLVETRGSGGGFANEAFVIVLF